VRRLDLFHELPGVCEEGAFFDIVWGQIRRQLKRGKPLNRSEQLVLAELLKRLSKSPEARKALGVKRRPPTASRNDRIADMYIRLLDEGKEPRAAQVEVARAFPNVRTEALRSVIQSNKWLAPARARQLAAAMLKNSISGLVIKAP